MTQRASGWGSIHPPYKADSHPHLPKISEAGDSLNKSRIGKGTPSLVCQECEAEGAVQLPCLHVLCRTCAKEHVCDA